MLNKDFFKKQLEAEERARVAEDANLEEQLMASPEHHRDTVVQDMRVAHANYIEEMGETAFKREIRRDLGQ